MKRRHLERARATALVVALVCAGACDAARPGQVPPGLWGGVGLVVTVSQAGADAEFDCAVGRIAEPLSLDPSGRFAIRGSITLGHGGPEREDEEPDVRPAVYSGWLDGRELHIDVTIDGLATTGEPFVLRQGDPGLLRRCL